MITLTIYEACKNGDVDFIINDFLTFHPILDIINIQDGCGWAPLHYACYNGHIEIVKLLIKNGADLNIKNENGTTPLDFAKKCGYEEIIKILTK